MELYISAQLRKKIENPINFQVIKSGAQVVSTTPVVLVYPTPGSFTNLTSLFVGNESAVTTDVVLNNGSGSITMPLASGLPAAAVNI